MKIDENTIFEAAYDDDAAQIRASIVNEHEDPNVRHPRSGHTPLQAAAESNALKAMEELLTLGADPNLRFTKISRVDGRVICAESVALMHVTTVDAADLLIRHGAVVNVYDGNGLTPIDWASEDGNTELVNFLKDRI